jgi:1-aminocyclopropane-1-carboxylate deaminase
LQFVSREDYAKKNTAEFAEALTQRVGVHYLIPEGGNNVEGVLGCMDILKPDFDHDYILCACGTATTFAGILASAAPDQMVIGISVLKGENQLPADARNLFTSVFPDGNKTIVGNEALETTPVSENCIINPYAFNGYAKFNLQLLEFKNAFEKQFCIPLDHVYTAKLFYGVFDLLKQNTFRPGSRILVVHTGGLQGNAGFEARYPEAKGV